MGKEIVCPKCDSTTLHADKRGYSLLKGIVGLAVPGGVLWGLHGYNKIKITCLGCGHKFEAGQGKIINTEEQIKVTSKENTNIKPDYKHHQVIVSSNFEIKKCIYCSVTIDASMPHTTLSDRSKLCDKCSDKIIFKIKDFVKHSSEYTPEYIKTILVSFSKEDDEEFKKMNNKKGCGLYILICIIIATIATIIGVYQD